MDAQQRGRVYAIDTRGVQLYRKTAPKDARSSMHGYKNSIRKRVHKTVTVFLPLCREPNPWRGRGCVDAKQRGKLYAVDTRGVLL